MVTSSASRQDGMHGVELRPVDGPIGRPRAPRRSTPARSPRPTRAGMAQPWYVPVVVVAAQPSGDPRPRTRSATPAGWSVFDRLLNAMQRSRAQARICGRLQQADGRSRLVVVDLGVALVRRDHEVVLVGSFDQGHQGILAEHGAAWVAGIAQVDQLDLGPHRRRHGIEIGHLGGWHVVRLRAAQQPPPLHRSGRTDSA